MKKSIILAALLTLAVSPVYASVSSLIGVDDTVKEAISKLESALSGLIERARKAGDSLILRAGRQTRATIDSAKVAYADSLHLTMKEINNEQREVFSQLDTVIVDTNTLLKERIKGVSDIENHFSLTIRDVFSVIAKDDPAVSSYDPLYTGNPKTVVTVQGLNLHLDDEKKPILEIGGRTLSPKKWITDEVSFEVPIFLLPRSDSGIEQITGKLLVPNKPIPFWKFWKFWEEDTLSTFHISLFVPPKGNIFEYEVFVKQKISNEVVKTRRTEEARSERQQYRDSVRTKCRFKTPGWEIVSSSAEVVRTKDKSTARNGVGHRTNSFSTTETTEKVCINVQAFPPDPGDRNWAWGYATFRERTIVEETKTFSHEKGALALGNSKVVMLPNNRESVVVKVKLFSGAEKEVPNNASLDWASIKSFTGTNQLQLEAHLPK